MSAMDIADAEQTVALYEVVLENLRELERQRASTIPIYKEKVAVEKKRLLDAMMAGGNDILRIPDDVVVGGGDDEGEDPSVGVNGVGDKRFLRVIDAKSIHTINQKSVESMFASMRDGAEEAVGLSSGFVQVINTIMKKCASAKLGCDADDGTPMRKKSKGRSKATSPVETAPNGTKKKKKQVTFRVEGDSSEEGEDRGVDTPGPTESSSAAAAADEATSSDMGTPDVKINVLDLFYATFTEIANGALMVKTIKGDIELSKSKFRDCKLTNEDLEKLYTPDIASLFCAWKESKNTLGEKSRAIFGARNHMLERKAALHDKLVQFAPNATLQAIDELRSSEAQESDKHVEHTFSIGESCCVKVGVSVHQTRETVKKSDFFDRLKIELKKVVEDILEESIEQSINANATIEETTEFLRAFGWNIIVDETEKALKHWIDGREKVVSKDLKFRIMTN